MNYLSIQIDPIKKFKADYPRKVKLANQLMQLSHILRDAALHLNEIGSVEQLLIQNIFRHFQEALIFAMRGEPAMCLSMVRIGIEGSRDLLRILEVPELVELYIEGPTSKEAKSKWKKSFQFNEETEKPLLDLYHICSNFGIHARTPMLDNIGIVKKYGSTNFVEVTQISTALDALILSMHAIEFSNFRIMTLLNERASEGSVKFKSISTNWYAVCITTTEETAKLFDSYKKRKSAKE